MVSVVINVKKSIIKTNNKSDFLQKLGIPQIVNEQIRQNTLFHAAQVKNQLYFSLIEAKNVKYESTLCKGFLN